MYASHLLLSWVFSLAPNSTQNIFRSNSSTDLPSLQVLPARFAVGVVIGLLTQPNRPVAEAIALLVIIESSSVEHTAVIPDGFKRVSSLVIEVILAS